MSLQRENDIPDEPDEYVNLKKDVERAKKSTTSWNLDPPKNRLPRLFLSFSLLFHVCLRLLNQRSHPLWIDPANII